jgi:hypothetical protein
MPEVAWAYPIAMCIRWPSPVARVPNVARSYRIPVSSHPRESGLRTRGRVSDYRRRRRRCVVAVSKSPEADTYAYEHARSGQQ